MANPVLRRPAHGHGRALRWDEGAHRRLLPHPGEVAGRGAREWTRLFPNPAGEGKHAEIEVRQLFELEGFGPSEAVERFRDMGAGPKK
jgi:hypothetical protein